MCRFAPMSTKTITSLPEEVTSCVWCGYRPVAGGYYLDRRPQGDLSVKKLRKQLAGVAFCGLWSCQWVFTIGGDKNELITIYVA